jgi:carbon-monoxide dehydrogenase large subunit
VDPELGRVEILRYAVAEDCGRMINPTVVEGQVTGGVAQGIGSVLLEEHRYDESGQLLTASLMDYLLPKASDVPTLEIDHLETPSPLSVAGIKGMGEGGTVGPVAAITNFVSDALVPLCGWQPVTRLPITPENVCRMIRAGHG